MAVLSVSGRRNSRHVLALEFGTQNFAGRKFSWTNVLASWSNAELLKTLCRIFPFGRTTATTPLRSHQQPACLGDFSMRLPSSSLVPPVTSLKK